MLRRASIAVVLVVAAAFAAAVATGVPHDGGNGGGSRGSRSATSLAPVTRRSLSETTQLNGTLGYAGSYTVLSQAHGIVTWLPSAGAVISDGQVLYRVDQAPVVLLYGRIPAYRTLTEGASGADVAQLNHDLVGLGYLDPADVDSDWNQYSWATRVGLENLQDHLGVVATGELSPAAVAFLPGAARVAALQAMLGAPSAGPVLQASSTVRTVRVALDPDLRSEVRAGDRVNITLPDGSTTPGRVTSVGKVAIAPSNSSANAGAPGAPASGPTLPVQVRPTDPRVVGSLDQAMVEVAIIDRAVHHVLAVPVSALLARSGGGYSVEVVAGDGAHRLVPVTVGLFDDAAGEVQVSGPRLAAGQRVVVPGHE